MMFSEAIKLKDGVFYHLPYHQQRMDRTTKRYFGKSIRLDLTPDKIPAESRVGLVKCRVVYAETLLGIEFIPYRFRTIQSVAVVHDDTIDYAYKSVDRSHLNRLLQTSGCDEIIIVKNGFVTDASSANLVFEDASGLYTPSTCLLPGTTRGRLLNEGVITEREIRLHDLEGWTNIYLINAMIGLEDRITLPAGEVSYGLKR